MSENEKRWRHGEARKLSERLIGRSVYEQDQAIVDFMARVEAETIERCAKIAENHEHDVYNPNAALEIGAKLRELKGEK